MDAAGYSLIAVYFAIVALARGALDARSTRRVAVLARESRNGQRRGARDGGRLLVA